jgi:voltage-gated potassium channel
MDVTLEFIRAFSLGLGALSPTLVFLLAIIVLLGSLVGRREKWTFLDAMYFACITATTVGYGDLRPLDRMSKFGAIAIALTGLLFTGILVAISLHALEYAYELHAGPVGARLSNSPPLQP